jgi:hypothetical protein
MSSKPLRTVMGFVGVVCLAACGNYSNDDLDFQLALPQQSDLSANVKLSRVQIDSAEYYKDTRNAITTFNAMVSDLLGLIENVRRYPATSRQGNRRIWGPFPSDKYPTTWQTRIVMDKSTVSPTILKMDYWVQVRPVGTDDSAWVSFLAGSYSSSGSARTGTGDIQLLAGDARNATYPVDDDPGLVNLDHLDVQYDNTTYPLRVTMAIVNLPTATTQSSTYNYSENLDGSGSMTFDWQGTPNGVSIAARMKAQWLGSGAGRADLTGHLTANTSDSTTLLGTDCWGVDTVASYRVRYGDTTVIGDPSACLL